MSRCSQLRGTFLFSRYSLQGVAVGLGLGVPQLTCHRSWCHHLRPAAPGLPPPRPHLMSACSVSQLGTQPMRPLLGDSGMTA